MSRPKKKTGPVLVEHGAGESVTAKEHLGPTGEGAGFQQMKEPVTWLVVKRALPVNTRIVEAHPFGKPQQVKVVRVRDNRNFVRGMLLEARWVQGNTFELVGPLPRWHGKWGYPHRVEPVLVAPGAKETKTK